MKFLKNYKFPNKQQQLILEETIIECFIDKIARKVVYKDQNGR